MKTLAEYIKECLDTENFAYKYDVWFQSDTEHQKPFLELLTKLSQRKIVQKEDIESFLLKYNNFKMKKFVDFFDEDVTRDEAINVDYIYLFSNIIKTFITNFNLQHKIKYQYQALNNGTPNVQIDTTDLYDNIKEES